MTTSTFGRVWNAPLTFWLILALPSFGMLAGALGSRCSCRWR